MKSSLAPFLTAIVFLIVLLGEAPAGPPEDAYQKLIDAQAASVVKVRFALSVRMTMRGQSQDSERSGTTTGVLLDSDGLIVLSSAALNPQPRFPGRRRRPGGGQMPNLKINSTVTSLRVVFPGDPKEYDAVLGATDSRLGLAFVRVRDLEGKAVQPADLGRTGQPRVGMRVYGVSRLSQGFDFAAFGGHAHVVAHVAKPRDMWLLQGQFAPVAHPLFDETGAALGFVAEQEGVGEGRKLPFLLPLDTIQRTIESARKEAAKTLEEAREQKAEDAASDEEDDSGDAEDS